MNSMLDVGFICCAVRTELTEMLLILVNNIDHAHSHTVHVFFSSEKNT